MRYRSRESLGRHVKMALRVGVSPDPVESYGPATSARVTIGQP